MPWKTEDLIGTKDGVNKNFTVSFAPFLPAIKIIHQGTKLRRVTSQPNPEEYTISGTVVKSGRAPQAGEDFWTTYFYET